MSFVILSQLIPGSPFAFPTYADLDCTQCPRSHPAHKAGSHGPPSDGEGGYLPERVLPGYYVVNHFDDDSYFAGPFDSPKEAGEARQKAEFEHRDDDDPVHSKWNEDHNLWIVYREAS